MVECEYNTNEIDKNENVVLIDTWWNVNSYYNSQSQKDHTGFNRYMVECE